LVGAGVDSKNTDGVNNADAADLNGYYFNTGEALGATVNAVEHPSHG